MASAARTNVLAERQQFVMHLQSELGHLSSTLIRSQMRSLSSTLFRVSWRRSTIIWQRSRTRRHRSLLLLILLYDWYTNDSAVKTVPISAPDSIADEYVVYLQRLVLYSLSETCWTLFE